MGQTRVPYGHLGGVMSEVVKQGAILAVHAEEDDVVNYMRQKLKREGRDQGYNLPLVHNNLSEDLSFRTVIRIARHAGTALYLLHVTAREGLDAIAEARARDQAVYGEALHKLPALHRRGLLQARGHDPPHLPVPQVGRRPGRANRRCP